MRWNVVYPDLVSVSLVADGLISAMLACAYLAPVAVVGPEKAGPTTPRTLASWMSFAAAAGAWLLVPPSSDGSPAILKLYLPE